MKDYKLIVVLLLQKYLLKIARFFCLQLNKNSRAYFVSRFYFKQLYLFYILYEHTSSVLFTTFFVYFLKDERTKHLLISFKNLH